MPTYAVGIDLGTTNSAVAYTELQHDKPQVQLLPIPQLVAAGTIEARPGLPSFLYVATANEQQQSVFQLPWQADGSFVAGEFARRQSADFPDRTVGGAKSWLCHSRVDRRQPILPWNAPPAVNKVSPVTASQRYLEHLVGAWNTAFPQAPLHEQVVVLTVPASFDAAARELTREAALAAGLPEQLVLLEEPQAAIYAWLDHQGDRWRRALRVGETLLVCDVGGGTTDLTLVGVTEERGSLELQRIAVGNHLLVGGDNMDLALAHFVAQRFGEKGVKLDPWQSVSLWHSCRAAKETLLTPDGPATHTISVLGRGSRLIGGTVSVEVQRDEVAELLVNGFFPQCRADERPARRRTSGFQEIGLPFEPDTAVTRHVAAFLQDHATPEAPLPTHLLFNGGVFKSPRLRDRLIDVLSGWGGKKQPKPRVLEGRQELDFGVALGAAYYGWAKEHGGVRIRGGTARSYYVGIETAGLAVPGAPRPLRALCVVPFGMEEGTETDVPSSEIGLVVGEAAQFRFFSSPTRKQDKVGETLDGWSEGELSETDPLEATLTADESIKEPYVPVRFHSRVTELGVFELWCVHTRSDARWKLEFSVREEET